MGSGDDGSDNDSAATQAVPDLGPRPERIDVDAQTVRRLVAEQFGQWAHLPVTPVRQGGWDNHTFHLGSDLLVRLPSAAAYALAVEKEQHWLPRLAEHLPLPVPSPCGLGVPGEGYPFPWTVQRWLTGERASFADVVDQQEVAEDLAGFVAALRRIDPADGPQPGLHNWFRGATLGTYDATARRALDALAGLVDVDLAAATWEAALDAPWDGEDTWFHGDLAEGNLLLEHGRLVAVIDFGTCGVGDPSCDLAVAWTLLTAPARRTFRDRLGIDDASWARGRGWALWKTLSGLAGAVADGDEDEAASLTRVLGEILGTPRRPDVTTVEIVGGTEKRELVLMDHDPRWREEYAEHERRIRTALGPTAVQVEHIGSTSVPGLAAKPIIDVLVTVADLTAEEDYLDQLLAAGYELRVREPGHRLVRTSARDVHVHVLAAGAEAAEDYLLFRDRLLSDPADRDLYERTKRALVEEDWADMNAYADAKTEVVAGIKDRARDGQRPPRHP